MSWNVESLKHRLDELAARSTNLKNDQERLALNTDIYFLKTMLNFKCNSETFPINQGEDCFKIIDTSSYEGMIKFLQTEGPELAFKLCCFAGCRINNINLFPRRINNQDAHLLLLDFFQQFDTSLLDLYLQCIKENRIEYGTEPFGSPSCQGRCFPMLCDSSSYIYTINKNRVYDLSVVCHELAHAKQFQNVSDIFVYQKQLSSVLSEAYPLFVQLCFYDYIKDTKYKTESDKNIADMLDTFFLYIEYKLNSLYHIKEASYGPSGNLSYQGFARNAEMIELILSNLFAFYWFSIYLNNPQEAISQVNIFNENFKSSSFEELYNLVGADKLIVGTKETICNYKRRNLKK